MIVLEVNKSLQNLIGLAWIGGGKYHEHSRIIAQMLVSFSMFLFTLWTILNFVWNVNDNIVEALTSMRTAPAFFMTYSIHLSCLINRANFYSLFEDLQAIVDDSKYESCGLN